MKIVDDRTKYNITSVGGAIPGEVYQIEDNSEKKLYMYIGTCNKQGTPASISGHIIDDYGLFVNVYCATVEIKPKNHKIKRVNVEVHIKD